MMAFQALAVPANPMPITVTQPDGTQLTIKTNGDEYYNFMTTADGYTVVKNDQGYYTYAQLVDGKLAASSTIARNEADRSTLDNAMLSTVNKRLIDKNATSIVSKARSQRAKVMQKSAINYEKFRGLIVLVEFNDCSFQRGDEATLVNDMVNKKNYTGFVNEDGTPNAYGTFTGSARDYFYDNSNGIFDPQFDVVGPVKINYSVDDPKQTSNAYAIVTSAIRKAYTECNIDFSKYDVDGDGTVDMFYVIFAGTGSNVGGGNHIWPHASNISTTLGGYNLSRYACSCELYYSNIIDGIGTICHEFSHVLGLPDLYDTDYSENGQSHDPGLWDVMAGGNYNNYARTPCGYSAYDRYAAGFMTPTVISSSGSYSLASIDNNVAYRLNTNSSKEYFLLENRQLNRWDAYNPGHGLMVARVDSTNAVYWNSNKVNAYSTRQCYELLRAGNSTSDAVASDPFPGTNGVRMISNTTTPGFTTPYHKNFGKFALTDITEADSVITFNAVKEDEIKTVVEDFENMAVASSTSLKNVDGNFCKWSFVRSAVSAPGSTKCNGTHSVAMTNPSSLTTTTATGYDVKLVSVTFFNLGSTTAKFRLEYSTDEGTTWTTAQAPDGTASVEIPGADASTTITWTLACDSSNVHYRLTQFAGSKTAKVYVDDFTIYYNNEFSGVEGISSDNASALKAVKNGNTINVTGAAEGTVNFYNAGGQLIQSTKAVDGKAQFTAGAHGVYIISQAGKAVKVVL